MAPIEEATFFPPLDRCLDGEHILLTFRQAYEALCDPIGAANSAALKAFLSDDATIAILTKPFKPGTAETKSAFDTKTAAINVTPSGDGGYNIEEIKKDTTWLAKEAQIDELLALRFVVVESQTRPTKHLLDDPYAVTAELRSKTEQSRKLALLHLYLSERCCILRTQEILARYGLQDVQEGGRGRSSWLNQVGAKVFKAQHGGKKVDDPTEGYVVRCIKAIESRIKSLETGSGWLEDDGGNAGLEEHWGVNRITEIIHILQLMLTHLAAHEAVTSTALVQQWFDFAGRCRFFADFQPPSPRQAALVSLLQSLVAVFSIDVLKLSHASHAIDDLGLEPPPSLDLTSPSSPYITNTMLIDHLTEDMFHATAMGPSPATLAALGWGLILLRFQNHAELCGEERRQIQSGEDSPSRRRSPQDFTQPSISEQAVDSIAKMESTELVNPKSFLVEQTLLGCRAYDLLANLSLSLSERYAAAVDHTFESSVRLVLLNLLGQLLPVVLYGPELFVPSLAILNGLRDYWTLGRPSSQRTTDPILGTVLGDAVLLDRLLLEAQSRYPLETRPMLELARTVILGTSTRDCDETNYSLAALQRMRTLTHLLPAKFAALNFVSEGEQVVLQDELELFRLRTDKPRLITDGDASGLFEGFRYGSSTVVPAETGGLQISPEGKDPKVVTWAHEHSAIEHLSYQLASVGASSDYEPAPDGNGIDLDTAGQIIGVFATYLLAAVESHDATVQSEAVKVLLEGRSSVANDENEDAYDLDVVGVIFNIFEQELERLAAQPRSEESLDVLVNCMQFLYALSHVSPNRVWSFLSRSSLLSADGSGSLVAIVGSIEVATGRYDFLLGCIHLFDSLIDKAASSALFSTKSLTKHNRLREREPAVTSTLKKIMARTLDSLTVTLLDVFERLGSWKFASASQKSRLVQTLCAAFDKVIRQCHGYETEQVDTILGSSAAHIVDSFTSTASSSLAAQTLILVLSTAASYEQSTVSATEDALLIAEAQSAIALSTTLLRTDALLNHASPLFAKPVYKALPLLARLFVMRDSYKTPIANLLRVLVTASSTTSITEAPLLLSHMGPDVAKAFITSLAQLGKPLSEVGKDVAIWELLSALVGSNQQWFAVYLLTGSAPRHSSKPPEGANASGGRGKALLEYALDKLGDLSSQPLRARAMLKFVAQAQNKWPWVTHDIRKNKVFLSTLCKFLGDLQPASQKDTNSNRYQIASYISEILAVYLHNMRQLGDYAIMKELVPNLAYLTSHAFKDPSYNVSLHHNLKKNFEQRYRGCSLGSFKRTPLIPSEFGDDYCYDVEFAADVLRDETSARSKRSTFQDELRRANVNLSLVDAQVQLLKTWQLLAIELSASIKHDSSLPSTLGRLVGDCLRTNAESHPSQALFSRLVHIRTNFSFVILQKLVESNCTDVEVKQLVSTTWTAIRSSGTDFDTAFTSDDAEYYRSLLRILFLALQCHIASSSNSAASLRSSTTKAQHTATINLMSDLLEILTSIVAKGFQSLCSQLHEDSATGVLPADFVLLTGLLQAILSIPETHTIHSQIALSFSNTNTARYATSLFSWSDRLTNDDPIYGELSILFLLQLSSIPLVAESFAVDGILARLSTANLTSYFRRPKGMGPFSSPPRLHSIWTRGLLPLCLNILNAVGAPVAAEISSFLNGFEPQLTRASSALNNRAAATRDDPHAGQVTLSMAMEAHSLALLHLMIERFRLAGPAEGINGADVEPLAWDAKSVKEDVDGYLSARRGLRERIVPTSDKEIDLARAKPTAQGSDCDNRLEERVVAELRGVKECLDAVNGG